MRGADRISELHDSILNHILSYLTTKEAVRTGSLSKRWRNVWASVPVLDIDFDAREDFDVNGERHEKFEKFIDTVLTSRQVQRVDRFRLVYQNDFTFDIYDLPLKRWIHYVSQQCPRVLSMFLQHTNCNVGIPYLIFSCLSLEEIDLQFFNAFLEDLNLEFVTLPHLRKLNLGHFHIEADFMDNLLLGCPSLEELELYVCWLDISQIYGGNLKSLVINGCYHSTEIEVSIPSLQYLKVTVMSSQTAGYVFKNMSSLVKACICLLAMNEMLIFNSEAKIIEGLLGMTALDIVLCGLDAKDMLKHIFKNCPYFENLKFMHFESFDGCMTGCIDTVDCLVQHSPVLKEVTVYDCQDDADGKIDLIEELRKLLGEYGILVERHEGSIYGSVSELKELLRDEYLYLSESIGGAVDGQDGEGEGEEEGGGVWWEDGEGNEGEASSAQEEEEGGGEANEFTGGSMEEGEEMEEEEDA